MAKVYYEDLCTTTQGPFRVVRACKKCRAVIQSRQRGGGRSAGFREGNKGNGLALAHWKDKHPAELENLRQTWAVSGSVTWTRQQEEAKRRNGGKLPTWRV